jgi:L-asparaginase / beta-aspartyl-peptidase
MPEVNWSIIIHGGAKSIAAPKQARNRAGLIAAVDAGRLVLAGGGSALDAVEAAVKALEDDPIFNAGYGSVLNADGEVEMDAAIMDGETLAIGGVAATKGLRNPISVARLMLEETPTLLAADGARRFAQCRPEEMIAKEQLASEADRRHDTVGCVAVDTDGRIAAGTSTGGLPGKAPGRIGDSPLPGCGLYAEAGIGGVSLSGDGEKIARTVVGATVMQALAAAPPMDAAKAGITRLGRVGGEAGAIVLDARGRFGCAHNSEHFAVGAAAAWLNGPRAYLHRSEMEELTADD